MDSFEEPNDGLSDPAEKPKKKRRQQKPRNLEGSSSLMLRRLGRMMNKYGKSVHRMYSLVTFTPRLTEKGKILGLSQVEMNDRPEVELYLRHRDEILAIDRDIEKCADVDMANDTDNGLNRMNVISSLRGSKHKHLAAMEGILDTLTKEFGSKEAIMAKLAADGAKLTVSMKQHNDRLEVAKSKTGMIDMSEADVERIANE